MNSPRRDIAPFDSVIFRGVFRQNFARARGRRSPKFFYLPLGQNMLLPYLYFANGTFDGALIKTDLVWIKY